MPDQDAASSSTIASSSRPKASRSSHSGVVRGRTSPVSGSAADSSADSRPQKRARKAINCEPCRNSKLKCDRNRPCSSCVLRGTSAMCYQDGRGHEGDSYVRGDDHHYARIDPAAEIARLRHSITMLESYVFPHQRNAASHVPSSSNLNDAEKSSNSGATAAPGMLGSKVQGGLYAGPTSAALHLLSSEGSRGSEDDTSSRQPSQERSSNPAPDPAEESSSDFPGLALEYDRDLLGLLPTVEVIDGLILYYFEYCNWIYRHVNQTAFSRNWERFKNGVNSDRIILALACAIMAIATHYLPTQHPLLESFSETYEQLGQKFFDVSTQALQRKQQETKKYSLELVELLLIRSHYLVMLKNDSEEIWHIRGELVAIGTAMGLHRDPGKWRMHRDLAERRSWQAFMFGRPLAIASHHFDTQLPSYCDPAIDKTDIMDDAVSVRPVPYESVQANDRALTQWMDNLPSELNLDEYRVARNLASSNANLRRLGVQSVIIRTSYYHIRFTLHRPYASAGVGPAPSSSTTKPSSDNKHSQSLEIAVGAASELITMVGQSRPDFLANSSLALIANPDQPGASLFRASIKKAVHTLETCRAHDILFALAPLYSGLAFPYHDGHDPRRFVDHSPASNSSGGRAMANGSPVGSSSVSPPLTVTHALSSMRTSSVYNNHSGGGQMHQSNGGQHPTSPSQTQMSPTIMSAHSQSLASPSSHQTQPYGVPQQQQVYPDSSRYAQYVHSDNVDDSMWGAAVGFGQGEWSQFLDGFRPGPNVVSHHRHLHGLG
ncbi:hypothetical protein BT96DRAFT_922689 [Gymnopus androsaceus JB14]|uniref:Zn(2)-C6 fungal-type domain-containing protein n=1 Tax=Gymnopus androsaceus JB14 TaxID=1447944 RepID=A0A6A4HEJ3_9AGAR|nr:hypothetical protein BT96DRAFT_922689 [Gymnopus androsaceus JB14]